MVDVAVATLALAAALVVIGAAVRLCVDGVLRMPAGLGVTLGLGTAAVSVPVSIVFALGGRALVGVAAVLAASAVAWVAAAGLRLRRRQGASGLLRAAVAAVGATRLDLVAAGVTAVALLPIARHGLTYWTTGANDYPSYAASVEVWASGGDRGVAFLDRHPDGFGEYQLWRAQTAKPMATALLLLGTRVTGLEAAQLLTPVTIVLFFLLASALLSVTATLTPGRRWPVAVATVVPLLSVVPLARVYDAQPGQAAAVALLAVLLAVAAADRRPAGRWPTVVVAAVVGAAALGMNPTLVVGSAPAAAAVLLGVLWRRRGEPGAVPPSDLLLAAAGAFVLSLPFLGGYVSLGSSEADGTGGFDVPFPSPASLIALQRHLVTGSWTWAWVALLVAAAVGFVVLRLRRPGPWWPALVVLGVVANGVALVVVYHEDSYTVHKFLALAIALFVPLAFAGVVGRLSLRGARTTLAGVGLLAAAASVNAVATADAVPVVVTDDFWDIATDPRVAELDEVNVRVSDIYEVPLLATLLENDSVVVTELTYAPSHPPRGEWAIIHSGWWDLGPMDEVIDLSPTYQLVRFQLPTVAAGERVDFGADAPGSSSLLYGRWYRAADGDMRAAGREAWIAFALPDELVGQELELRLTGRFGTSGGGSLLVQGEGASVASGSLRDDQGRTERDVHTGSAQTATVTIPAEATSSDDGRLVVRLSASDAGQFWLRLDSMRVGAAAPDEATG
ncbi:hypothetical protein [Cellulomonas sp. Y8]|uniref:hypothetical protein n=1 Tax=Cellulomonas sp. Y8 TaxID=2591145 RepID=UPI0011CC1509|nr:hypothetical protein [Cellulomonas sp. Y8]